MPTNGVMCPACRYEHWNWLSYHCPECGALHESLYRREHQDPQRAKQMTSTEIEAEIAAAVRAGTYELPVEAA